MLPQLCDWAIIWLSHATDFPYQLDIAGDISYFEFNYPLLLNSKSPLKPWPDLFILYYPYYCRSFGKGSINGQWISMVVVIHFNKFLGCTSKLCLLFWANSCHLARTCWYCSNQHHMQQLFCTVWLCIGFYF